MATIKDVAALAGVSYTTVSHVLNATRPVNPGTRERVLEAAQKLSYVPSAVARSLKHRVTHTVGLIVPNSTNSFFGELARGIEDACYRAGYTVVLCNSDDELERQQTYLRVLRQKQVDGMVIASASNDAQWLAALREVSFPLVFIDRAIEGLSADQVQVDNERGGRLAAQHLMSLGHRALACIAGPPSGLDVSSERLCGFAAAVREAGIQIPPAWIEQGNFTPPGGYRAAMRLLAGPERPTAIFACNDMMAVGALRAAAECGMVIPRDLSIVGFDDVELSRYVYPALTTIGQPIRELGRTAVDLMLGRLAQPGGVPVCKRLKPNLLIRESSGRPPRATLSLTIKGPPV